MNIKIIWFILIGTCIPLLICCNNGNTSNKAKDLGKIDSSSATAIPKNTNVNLKAPDTILFVGVFARWQKQQGEYFDGTYDTSRKIFKMCTNHQYRFVPQSQITFQAHGNCDTSPHELMAMMLEFRSDSIVPFPENVVSIQLDTIHKKAVGVFGTDNSTKNIQLNDWDYKRIEATHSAADKTNPVQEKITIVHSMNPSRFMQKTGMDTVNHH